ncbi:malate dehydrogenase, cytoplasmic [Monosporozyma servazzii]
MVKVCVLGAFGGIGQPLSLLLKINPHIDELSLYDLNDCQGISKDLSHINTKSTTSGFDKDTLKDALQGSDMVVIPAGMARKEGMTRDDLFKVNANIMKTLCLQIGQTCPENVKVLIISNPVNCLVPVAVETFRKLGKLHAENIIGITTLDIVRAETFLREHLRELNNEDIEPLNHDVISVVGGHSGTTIVPIIPDKNIIKMLGASRYKQLVHRIQFGGDEVIKAKKSRGSATLSMAYAASEFITTILLTMVHDGKAEMRVREQKYKYLPGYVYLPGLKNGAQLKRHLKQIAHLDVDYFAVPLKFKNGSISEVDATILTKLSQEEVVLLRAALEPLQENIKKGEKFVQNTSKM